MMNRKTRWLGAAFALALLTAAAAEKAMPLTPLKAWRGPSDKAVEKTFQPVLKDDSIQYGNKTLELTRSGRIVCSTPEGQLFSCNAYFFLKDKEQTEPLWGWQSSNMDPERTKFRRDGNKYIWEVWYKSDKVEPFRGLEQTLEVLPDGRLSIEYRLTMPPDRGSLSFKAWTWTLSMSEILFRTELAELDGKMQPLDQLTKYYFSPEKQAETTWKFGLRNPGRKFIVSTRKNEVRKLGLTRRKGKGCDDYQIQLIQTGKPKAFHKIFLDLRQGTDAVKRDLRGGIDFKAQENLTLPDNTHKNLVENGSFESGLAGWHTRLLHFSNIDRQWDLKAFTLDEKVAYDGNNSLRMETAKWNPWWLPGNPQLAPTEFPLDPGIYTLSFYARGEEGADSWLYAWSQDYHGNQSYARNKDTAKWRFKLTPQWKRYQCTYEVKRGEPMQFITFMAMNEKKKSLVWLDAVQMEKGKQATAYEAPPAEGRLLTSDPENFISSKAKIDGRLRITTAKPGMAGKVRVTVKNFFSEQLLDLTREFKTGSDRTADVVLPLDDLPGLGVFVLKAEYELADGTKSYDFRRYTKVEFQDMSRPLRRFFGVDYLNPAGRYNFEQVLDRWRKLGIGIKHHVGSRRKEIYDMYLKYGVQPTNSTMLTYTRSKNRAVESHVEHFYIVDAQDSPWTVNKSNEKDVLIRDFHLESGGKITPEYLAKLKNAAKTMASKYSHIKLWALGGELSCKMPNEWWAKGATHRDVARMVAQLLKAFAEGVREGNPQAKVYQDDPANMAPRGGIAETDLLLDECNKIGLKFDVIAIHPYRATPENPDLDSDTKMFLDMLKKHGYGNTPVMWPEGMSWGPYRVLELGKMSGGTVAPWGAKWGMVSYDMGWTEKLSAAFDARAFLVALKYSHQIVSADSGLVLGNEYMDSMLTPYAAMLVPNTLCSVFGKIKFKKDIRFAPYIRTYVFEDEKNRPIAAVWCHNELVDAGRADAPVVEADFGGSLEAVIDLMNSPREFKPGRMRFPVTPFPLFFRGKPGTLKQMIDAFEAAEPVSSKSIPQLAVSANPVDVNTLRVTIENYISREFRGKFNGSDLRVAPAGKTVRDIPLSVPLRKDRIALEEQTVKIRTAKGVEKDYTFKFEAFAAGHVPENATVDSLDWSKLPAIPFTRKTRKDFQGSGTFRIGWNHSGLFLEAAVKDAKFVHVEYPNASLRWNNDCLQVYFDTFGNARQRQFTGYDGDDYDYAVFPNAKGTSAQVFRLQTVESQLGLATQAPQDNTFAPDMPCRFTNKDGVLTYRVFFPAKYLLPMKLQPGWVFGFSLLAPNSDQPGKTNGALTLDLNGVGNWRRPHLWPAVILTE